MDTIEPLTMPLIERALKAGTYNYMTDSDGDYRINYDTETSLGHLNLVVSVGGERKDLFRIYGWFDNKIPEARLSQAIYFCNQYHRNYLFPTVYVVIAEEDGIRKGRFWVQQTFDLEKGIHQEGLLNFTRMFVGGCISFHKWILKEPETWLT